MTHLEILAKADGWLRGELSPTEQNEVTAHLKSCPVCRELVGKWPRAVPQEGFAARVMARLQNATVFPSLNPRVRLAFFAGAMAALVLTLAAFWHPERKWVEEDKFFARFDHGGAMGAVQNHKENFYE